jgi:hypothetical protein
MVSCACCARPPRRRDRDSSAGALGLRTAAPAPTEHAVLAGSSWKPRGRDSALVPGAPLPDTSSSESYQSSLNFSCFDLPDLFFESENGMFFIGRILETCELWSRVPSVAFPHITCELACASALCAEADGLRTRPPSGGRARQRAVDLALDSKAVYGRVATG